MVILGSTGSVGTNALNVIDRFPERFELLGLTAYRNIDLLVEQIRRFRPRRVAVGCAADADRLRASLGMGGPRIGAGVEELVAVATLAEASVVISAIVGAAGLVPTLAAVQGGKRIALANKETMVMAGRLVLEEARRSGAEIIPVDSEHSAIYQCLAGGTQRHIRRLILTASGGPFFGRTREEMAGVTVAQALQHPRWEMGKKISIDSATLMNKGLEVIEARWLFDIPVGQIEVLVHPQSIVHSMVEFEDGSTLAQMGLPDMRLPIAYALAYPDRLPMELPVLDLPAQEPLSFAAPDHINFPCLTLAREAIRRGGLLPTVLNAANEEAVSAFLNGRIGFLQIPELIAETLRRFEPAEYETVDDVLRTDRKARTAVKKLIA